MTIEMFYKQFQNCKLINRKNYLNKICCIWKFLEFCSVLLKDLFDIVIGDSEFDHFSGKLQFLVQFLVQFLKIIINLCFWKSRTDVLIIDVSKSAKKLCILNWLD